MLEYRTLTVELLADSFGTTVDDIPEECTALLNQMDVGYHVIGGKEYNDLITDVIARINLDNQVIGASIAPTGGRRDGKRTWIHLERQIIS